MHTRRGFIFLYVLGLISVTSILAFALLGTASAARTGATEMEMDLLATRAAKEGVQHGIEVLRREFATGAGIPTQLSDRWRSHFWPIDAHLVGFDTPTHVDDAPTGLEFTPEDLNQNDVPIENGLTEPYLEVDNSRGIYKGRDTRYGGGWFNHPGMARWYEPGKRSDDPVDRPLSFHLQHPAAADPSSTDPARAAGEPYAPDLDQPIWYDSELVATNDPAQRRYRLRYAVAIEDLSGHLLCAVPGEFDPSAVSVFDGMPQDEDRYKINEVDNTVADRYAGVMSNMFRYTGSRVWEWGDIGLRGLGATQQHMGYQLGFRQGIVLASRGPGGELTYFDDAEGGSKGPYYLPVDGSDARMNHESVKTGSDYEAHYFGVGPFPSYQAIWHDASNVNSNRRPFLFTPFGRAPERVGTPTAWYHSRVDTPWRVNLPTMAPRALTTMLYAYVPAEFKTQGSDEMWTQSWSEAGRRFQGPKTHDTATSGSASEPAKFSHTVHAVELFEDMAGVAHFDRNGGVAPGDPYPGTDLAAPGDHWGHDLGKEVHTNLALGHAGMGILNSDSSYPAFNFGDETILSQRWDGGIIKKMEGQLMRWDAKEGKYVLRDYRSGYDADAGFYHHGSYWLDLTVSMLHAVAVARFSWLDRVNGAHSGDPESGRPAWDAGIPVGYFPLATAAEFSPGSPTRDRDVDGDGIPDVPSAFDTIAEVDQQFLRNLGEWPEDYARDSRPEEANGALRCLPAGALPGGHPSRLRVPGVAYVDLEARGSKTIKKLRTEGTITPEQAALMELILNDMRMSFFGASPDYPEFRPIDFDDNGMVSSSCYAAGEAAADPLTGKGPVPETWFSLTGCFTLEKSRYYRMFTRGQLFDEIRGVPVAETNLETVYVLDPDGDLWDIDDLPSPTTGNGLADSHILYQRQLNNRYQGTASSVDQ